MTAALALAAALVLAQPGAARADPLMVFAAASAAEAMDEVVRLYGAEGGETVRTSYAASSTLARQIESGAPADLFLSANGRWMDYLAERGYVVAQSRRRLLGNRLVLIAPGDSDLELEIAPAFPLAEALGEGYLAMGDPDHVPAGIYGREALEALGVWSAVAGRVARAPDVRAALVYVARGEAAAGITYATDALVSKDVRVVATFPASSHGPIAYDVALVAGSAGQEARRFLRFLTSAAARQVFERYGFRAFGGD